MNYNVTLKELPERYVASVRKIIPNYDQEGIALGIISWRKIHLFICEMP